MDRTSKANRIRFIKALQPTFISDGKNNEVLKVKLISLLKEAEFDGRNEVLIRSWIEANTAPAVVAPAVEPVVDKVVKEPEVVVVKEPVAEPVVKPVAKPVVKQPEVEVAKEPLVKVKEEPVKAVLKAKPPPKREASMKEPEKIAELGEIGIEEILPKKGLMKADLINHEGEEVLLLRPPANENDFSEALNYLPWRTDEAKIIKDQGRLKSSKGADIKYLPLSPLEYNLRTKNPSMIIHDSKSLDVYKKSLKDEVVDCQRFTLGSTKQMTIAVHSMMVTVYRLPQEKQKKNG
jgi:hypothetical protein